MVVPESFAAYSSKNIRTHTGGYAGLTLNCSTEMLLLEKMAGNIAPCLEHFYVDVRGGPALHY